MNTNDIQELFDGGLGDDRMAELLHVLSVSPEKRAAFRQHMTLRAAIEQDRLDSALKSDEDALIWGAIVGGGGGASIVSTTAGSWGRWLAGGAAAVALGVLGYLLGSGSSDEVPNAATMSPVVAEHSAEHSVVPSQAPPAMVQGQLGSTVDTVVETKVVYRDRYIKVPVYLSSPNGLSGNSGSPALASGAEVSSADPLATSSDASGASFIDPASSPQGSNVDVSSSTQGGVFAEQASVVGPRTDRSIAANDGPVPDKPVADDHSADNRSKEQPEDGLNPPKSAPVRANGIEITYAERVGRLTPVPQGIENADPDFSNRSVGAMLRFSDGQFGLGGRLVYGTLANVSFRKTGLNATGGADWSATLQATTSLWFEVVGNWRLPLTDDLALTMEGSVGTAKNSMVAGGDLGVLWFLTDRIGAQAGIGLGMYRFDLREDRKRLIESTQNDGISSGSSDTYQGTILQGRYGLFYKF